MTERWISTKKYYCKVCNTWVVDNKIQRQQHEQTDKHKNLMQRNLSRLQRDELIKRTSGYDAQALPKPATGKPVMRNARANMANYGYSDRDDMAAWIREGKKMKFDNLPTAPPPDVYVPKPQREGTVGEWKVSKIISTEGDGLSKVEIESEVKKEESPPPMPSSTREETISREEQTGNKRERKKTPDAEDLTKFRVQEKTFPSVVGDDEEDTKAPVVSFKKRKTGQKNARVSTVLQDDRAIVRL
jgi:hypothetical protein